VQRNNRADRNHPDSFFEKWKEHALDFVVFAQLPIEFFKVFETVVERRFTPAGKKVYTVGICRPV
jgi:hypothetical protein